MEEGEEREERQEERQEEVEEDGGMQRGRHRQDLV